MEDESVYEELQETINENSLYKKKPTETKTMMSAAEMGKLLGLKKTDRYWLIHKNYFKTMTVQANGINERIWVDIESFEKWYANQVKYHKVNGEEPGRELKENSYSIKELSELLGISGSSVYDLIKKNGIETIVVQSWKRVPKEVFEKWYAGQKRYRTLKDREKDAALEAATISMPEMARLLGISRKQVYQLLRNGKEGYNLETVVVADRRRVTKESFEKFLNSQDKYTLAPENDYAEVTLEENCQLANYRRKKLYKTGVRRGNGNQSYLTRSEAALLAKVANNTVSSWISSGRFPVIRMGNVVRIPRIEYEAWLEQRKAEMEEMRNGVD